MPNNISEYLLKHNKRKNQNLKYDFMPDILEIIEKPAHKAGKIIIFVVFFTLFSAIMWASFAKLDIVLTAQGNIVPQGGSVNVQSQISGNVKNILVKKGELVEKGDILFEFDLQESDSNDSESETQIAAPIDGYISNMSVNFEGDAVYISENIATIVPSNMPMQIECYVNNKDIAQIKIDDEVNVKLDAYPYSEYGTIKGKINYISPEAYKIEGMGSVYEVTAEIENDNKNINIISGMTGIIEIKTGTRTVLSYFLEPILNGFENSLKEQ